jgi:di/tricarboxylate transporter
MQKQEKETKSCLIIGIILSIFWIFLFSILSFEAVLGTMAAFAAIVFFFFLLILKKEEESKK